MSQKKEELKIYSKTQTTVFLPIDKISISITSMQTRFKQTKNLIHYPEFEPFKATLDLMRLITNTMK